MALRTLVPFLLVVTSLACSTLPRGGAVSVAVDRPELLQDGRPFRPWGFNYDRDYKSRLIEEYWHDEWETVVGDFREMRALGANVVRVHLQVAAFMDGPDRGNEKNLARLRDLVKLADEVGLKLDLTGLACYRRGAVPEWYRYADEGERWRVQQNFWRAIARACRGANAVFCYDLMNEPIVPHEPRAKGDFQVGDLGGFTYCQYVTLDPKGRKREEVARAWVRGMVRAIREEDRETLITVGMLPNSTELTPEHSGFLPTAVAGELDFLCVHVYPDRKDLGKDLAVVKAFAAAGKPVVIEETFPLNCDAAELRAFLRRARPHAAGVLGFYWGQTPEELRPPKDIAGALTLAWLEAFQQGAP